MPPPELEPGRPSRPPHLRALDGIASPARRAFRSKVMERFVTQAVRTGRTAHEVNNATASLSANLSYLTMRLEELAQLAPGAGAELEALRQDLMEVVDDCDRAVLRIGSLTHALAEPDLRTPSEAPPAAVDLGETVRRLAPLLAGCTHDIALRVSGAGAPARGNEASISQLALELALTALEDGRAHGAPVPVELEAVSDREAPCLRVRRTGPSEAPPRLDVELAPAARLARLSGGRLEVHPDAEGYTLLAHLLPA